MTTASERHFGKARRYEKSFFVPDERTAEKRFRKWTALFPESLKRPGLEWLEIGCGTGLYTRRLTAFCQKPIMAMDLSAAMLREARRPAGPDFSYFLRAAAGRLPFGDGRFDAVAVFAALHHVEKTGEAFDETARVLKPGGHLLLVEPNAWNPVNAVLGLLRREERGMLRSRPRRWIDEAGRAGLACLVHSPGCFLPSWLKGRWADRLEDAMEKSRLRGLALFHGFIFQKEGVR